MPQPTLFARATFCVALILFIALKIPLLSYAFYWDESWVYAPAIYSMFEHGPSILPNAIPPELSRGHPLLFHAIYAVWMNVAGATNHSMHVLSLVWSVCLVLTVYFVLARRFCEETALCGSLVLLAIHEFFMASTFVLNDIMLGWLSLLAIHFYTDGHTKRASFVLALLILTKESGIAIWFIIVCDALWRFINHETTLRKLIPVSLIPGIMLCAFLLIQRYQMGWYFYPNHVDLITPGLENTLNKMQQSLRFIFVNSGAWITSACVAVFVIIAFIITKQKKLLVVLIYFTLLFANLLIFSCKDATFYAFIAVSLLLLIRYAPRINMSQPAHNLRFLRLTFAGAIAYLYFCCINFFETRYLFPCLLFIQGIFFPVALTWLTNKAKIRSETRYITTALILLVLCAHNRNFIEFDRMWVHSEVVKFMEGEDLYNAGISTTSFFEKEHLRDAKTGFRTTKQHFTNISDEITDNTRIVIVDNIETSQPTYPANFDSSAFRLLHKVHKGNATALVYAHK